MSETGVRAKVIALKESWEFTWDTLESARFEAYGIITRRGPDGIACFNIAQTVWLYPRVRMDWSPRRSRGVETFAVNALTRYLAGPRIPAHTGFTTQKVMDYAPLFMEECLLTMPASGGCIPLDFMVDWIRDELSWRCTPQVVAGRKTA